MGNKNILFIFFREFRWEFEFLSAFKNLYFVNTIYLGNEFKLNGYQNTINNINQIIREKQINACLFNVDFYGIIDFNFINKISSNIKIIFTHDDCTLHSRNLITSIEAKVDLVIVADPLSKFKYKQLGIKSIYLPLEGSYKYQFCKNKARDIDVLFFGDTKKSDRMIYINYLKEKGIKVSIKGGNNSNLSYDNLIEFIKKSKIVLNFSKTDGLNNISPESRIYNHVLELKGRIFEAGFCGALCVSEYSPSAELIFTNNEMPMFYNKEECFSIINNLLSDEDHLISQTQIFTNKCRLFRPNNIISNITINSEKSNNENLIKDIPEWYIIDSFQEKFIWSIRYLKPLDAIDFIIEFFKFRSNIFFKFKCLIIIILRIILLMIKSLIKRANRLLNSEMKH